MTCVHLVRSRTGQLLYCRAEGHSGYAAKGQDIVCAAVTVLLRTVVEVLSKTDGVQLNADFTTRGLVEFAVNKTGFSKKLDAELEFAGKFLEEGLSSLAQEYPENVTLYKQTEA